jgi:hypothetical protein
MRRGEQMETFKQKGTKMNMNIYIYQSRESYMKYQAGDNV